MKVFIPTRRKIFWTFVGIAILLSTFFLRLLPPWIDILDLRELPNYSLFLFGRIPISFFDWLTSNRYTTGGEGFLVFPSLPQVAFAMVFDVIVIYMMICLVLHWIRRQKS